MFPHVCTPRTPSSGCTTSRRNDNSRCHPLRKNNILLVRWKISVPRRLFPPPRECSGRLPRALRESFVKVERSPLPVLPCFRWRRPSYPCQLPVIKRIPTANHCRWSKRKKWGGGLYFEDNHGLWNSFRIWKFQKAHKMAVDLCTSGE